MRSWTYLEAKTKVEQDLDLQDETFILPSEMLAYFNEAIDTAEAEINKLGVEDEYFLTKANLPLTAGVSSYPLPSDLYANKLRAVVYNAGGQVYEIPRMRRQARFLEYADIQNFGSADFYQFMMLNSSAATGPRIELVPASRETSSTNVTLWYIRNANRLFVDTDLIDIPEFIEFILAFVKYRCKEKEKTVEDSDAASLEAERALMVSTLTEQIPDNHTEIEMDLSIYEDLN